MTINEAITQCRDTGLSGWALTEYAQKLVSANMTYSYSNSYDMPDAAFEKGRGYCWHQASALNMILLGLGINSRLVHAVRNQFSEKVFEGVTLAPFVSGHVWCRVSIGGEEKDVCPGRIENSPGVLHFTPLSKVKGWGKAIAWFSYHGSAMLNKQRLKKINKMKHELGLPL